MSFFAQARTPDTGWSAEAEHLQLNFLRRGPLGGLQLNIERLAIGGADLASLGSYVSLLQKRIQDHLSDQDRPQSSGDLPERPVRLRELRATNLLASAPNRTGIAWSLRLRHQFGARPAPFLSIEQLAASVHSAPEATLIRVSQAAIDGAVLDRIGGFSLASRMTLPKATIDTDLQLQHPAVDRSSIAARCTISDDSGEIATLSLDTEITGGATVGRLIDFVLSPNDATKSPLALTSFAAAAVDRGAIAQYRSNAGRRFEQTLDTIDRVTAANLLPYGLSIEEGTDFGTAFEQWVKEGGTLTAVIAPATPVPLPRLRASMLGTYEDKRSLIRSLGVALKADAQR
ncbi:hypothetical protein [Amorphus sp. 3PC139-8]|uniref:hypothetical protein n=1 Tax=Amorphus sp. 3PC139-8 TaxID=2735676 RepID=UPI00345DC005